MRREKGTITVFLSLVCILFLALICSVVESARIQGARAQTANITGIGNFSMLGEFEKGLLDQYEIFALDGSCGTGSFDMKEMEEHLETYLTCNADPKEGVFSVWCFDPWNLEMKDCSIQEYALLTDDGGEPFYQQVVAFMKENLPSEAVSGILRRKEDTEKVKTWQEEYEKKKRESETALSDAEKQKEQRLQELESEAKEEGGTEIAVPEEMDTSNPLEEIAKLRKRSVLSIVTGDRDISSKSISVWFLPSHGLSRKGSMKLEKKYSGLTSDLLFREYLLNYFPSYTDQETEGCLNYQSEYLISGNGSDQKNLKDTVNRLLLVREGMNYLYCVSNGEMSTQAGTLAFTLTGFLGLPAVTAATKHALLLAWAYGESLIDVRILLNQGKVPLFKDPSSWTLTLENLGKLTQILDQERKGGNEGLVYRDYLRILLNMGSLKKQKMRAIDLVQENLRQKKDTSEFKAENCIVGIKSSADWEIRPVFFSLAGSVMGIRGKELTVTQSGSMVYE